MPIPEQYRKQFEQQRQMAEMRSQLDKQYKKEMSKVALNDMPSFAEWMAKRQQQPMAKGGKVEVRPTVKDEALMRKIPQMEEAARKVSEGKMTHAAYDKVVAKHKPIKPYEFIPQPASDEDAQRALMENKKPHWRGHEDWPAGRKVGLRLDIPAYETHGVWVNSIHDEEGKGEDKRKTSYGPVSSVKNATFDAGPTKALKVATGEDNKSPFARIKGELHHMTEDEAVEHMKKHLNHPDYAQVGMDPRRHGFFYDRKTLQPVTHAKHVVQIGPLVLAHKPTYGERESYAKGGITHKATGGKVEPTQDEMRLALTKRHGLYSPLEKSALEMPRTKGTGAEFMTELSKRPGFKAEEVADRQIPVPEGKMNKAEFFEHLKKHSLPPLQEHTLEHYGDEDEALEFAAENLFGRSYESLRGDREARQKVGDWVEKNSAKYNEYQLPGGKNYREMLLQLPNFSERDNHRIMELEADKRRASYPDFWGKDTGLARELENLKQRKASMGEQYNSSHWQDHPNVLAHMRLSDRKGPNGEKLLHVEELQSDWHQEGRKKGYQRSEAEIQAEQERINKEHRELQEKRTKDYSDELKRVKQLLREMPSGANNPEAEALRNHERHVLERLKAISESEPSEAPKVTNYGVPQAPFKKSWHELAIKHALHHAAKHGYKGLVITPGQEQAKRYDLSKHISDLEWDSQTGKLSAWDHSGNRVISQGDVSQENLPDYIGKEAAQKLLQKEHPVKQMFGADLQVGGEGMKGFYDKIVPTYLNKLGKPHGAQVGSMQLETKPAKSIPQIAAPGIGHFPEPITEPAETVNVHHFPITEPMREKILKEGLPQYMRGGVIHKAEGGNVQPSIAQMKMEMAQKNSNVDLHNIGVNEAPDMSPKHFFPPARSNIRMPSPGGVATPSGMPIGGIDMSRMQGGQQLMPNPLPAPPQPPQGAQPPQGGQPPQPPQGQPPMGAQQGGGNILQMTPQGQTMAALGGQPPKAMADGGGVTVAGATGTGGFDLHIPITTGGGSSGGGSGGGISSLGGMMNQGGSNASSAPSAPPPPTGMYTNRQQFGTPMQNLSNGMGGSAPTNYPKPTSLAQLNAPAGGQNVQPNQPHTGGFNYATGRFNDVYQDPNQTAKTDINPNFMYGAGPTPMPVASSGVSGGQTPTAPINKADYFNERQKSAQEFGRSFDPSPQFMAWMNSPENISWEQYATRGQSSTPTMMYAKGGSATSTEAMKAELAAKKKPKFAIAPSQVPTKGPEHFTPYDKENPSKGGLQTAFDEAISHHLSLSPEDRMKNSVRASEAVGDIIGRTADGKVKDLLGKNAKLLKSEKGKDDEAVKLPDGRGIETTGLALAPAYREGKFDTCPNHHSCKEECLGKTSGNYFKLGGGQDLSEFKGPRLNSLLKTHAFMHDPHNFAVKLHDEISDAKAIAAQNGNHLGLRLNVLSDINPRIHKAIIEAHPDVTFYDYTKNNTNPIAPNHHYTYSSTGVSQPGVDNEHTNWKSMRRRLLGGDNVAMAFSHKDHLPEFVHDQETGHKFRVVNGDTHDFRPLDIQPEGEHGVIVGLKNKKATGEMDKAHVDSKGFFVHYDPQLKMTRNAKGLPVYERKASNRISPKTGKPMLGETIPQNKMVNIQTQTRGMIPISNDGESE
jgi:hypothetical protein